MGSEMCIRDRRTTARAGDDVWVSGTLGDAAAALDHWRLGSVHDEVLRARLDRPTPRVALGLALARHTCPRSAISPSEISMQACAVPASEALRAAYEGEQRHALQAAGGDDYELCFTAPAGSLDDIARLAAQAGTAVTWIGRIVAGEGVQVFDADGQAWSPSKVGYEHFG